MANTRPASRIWPSGQILPSTLFYPAGTLFLPGGSAKLPAPSSGVVTFMQSYNYIRPFEGNRKADVAPSENELDTPALAQYAQVSFLLSRFLS